MIKGFWFIMLMGVVTASSTDLFASDLPVYPYWIQEHDLPDGVFVIGIELARAVVDSDCRSISRELENVELRGALFSDYQQGLIPLAIPVVVMADESCVLELLVDSGLELNASLGNGFQGLFGYGQDDAPEFMTPLSYGIIFGSSIQKLSAFIDAGASINIADDNGLSPVEFALSREEIWVDREESCQELLDFLNGRLWIWEKIPLSACE